MKINSISLFGTHKTSGQKIKKDNSKNETISQPRYELKNMPFFTAGINKKQRKTIKELKEWHIIKKYFTEQSKEIYQNAKKIKERLDDIFNYEKELLLPFPNYNYNTKNMGIIISNLYFKYGNIGSKAFGIGHENQTPNNPQGEWNMDSWNNHQGREIASEIQKEYGDKFMKLSQQQRDDIIADKVMQRMRNGQLITNPNDQRKYTGIPENIVNSIKNIQETKLPFTPTRGIGGVYNNGIPVAHEDGATYGLQ